MVYTFQNNAWVLKTVDGKEVARFKTRRELMKFMQENPDAGTQETVSEEEEPIIEEEDSDEEEDEEDS